MPIELFMYIYVLCVYVRNSYTMAASGLWGIPEWLLVYQNGSHECVPHKP